MSTYKMTYKQIRFCQEYLNDFNATQAAIRSGYSVNTAYSIGQENLKKPEIQKYLLSVQNKDAKRNEISRDWIINALQKNHIEALKQKKISASNKALDLLAKMIGAYKDIPIKTVTYIGRHNLEQALAEEEERLKKKNHCTI